MLSSLISSLLSIAFLLSILSDFAFGLAFPASALYAGERLPARSLTNRRGFTLPILRQKRRRFSRVKRRGDVSGAIGLGDTSDLLYTVPIELGSITTTLHLDTGSSDLWAVTDACRTDGCQTTAAARYPNARVNSNGLPVKMHYGDSTTGSMASGVIAKDVATVAGIAMVDQMFGAVNDTNNPVISYGMAGIFGLGFPSGSSILKAFINQKSANAENSDDLILSTFADGPLLSRIALTEKLQDNMFAITLQRNTIDIGGHGMLTVGKLPDGINSASITWVPVRRYSADDGGVPPPSFAPNEVYPYRWEIEIDGVFLDGQHVPDSAIPAGDGITGNKLTALIDTGNSLLRGPSDVVKHVLGQVSPAFSAANDPSAKALLPCNTPRTLAFQIGGKMFPVDPRDFIGQHTAGDVNNCIADNLVATDPPSKGALFSWSLGDPFMKSNLVAFHYGNLTHPSVDPPRIGFLSLVPSNITAVFKEAVEDAQENGNNFESTYHPAPTESAARQGETTLSASAAQFPTASVSATITLDGPHITGVNGLTKKKNGSASLSSKSQSSLPLLFLFLSAYLSCSSS